MIDVEMFSLMSQCHNVADDVTVSYATGCHNQSVQQLRHRSVIVVLRLGSHWKI